MVTLRRSRHNCRHAFFVAVAANRRPVRASIDEKRIPGSVTMVNRGDKTIFARAYGKDSIEHDIAATLDTVFPLASVSKVFAGTVAMRLVEAGKLDLDTSMRDYLNEVPVCEPTRLVVRAAGQVRARSGLGVQHRRLLDPAGDSRERERPGLRGASAARDLRQPSLGIPVGDL